MTNAFPVAYRNMPLINRSELKIVTQKDFAALPFVPEPTARSTKPLKTCTNTAD